MYKNLIILLTSLCILPSCSRTKPNITVICEENEVGNCIIKWDAPSRIRGYVRVYASLNKDLIPESTPVGLAPVSAGKMVIIPNDPTKRYYYTMVFNNNIKIKVATRNINIPGIENFRDLGGYLSNDKNRETRWGMIYRSAKIDNINPYALSELKNIGIRTIIDLRTPEEISNKQPLGQIRTVHIPISTGNMDRLISHIRKGEKIDSIHTILKQMNQDLVTKYSKEYKQIFTILSDSSQYPLVIECSSGKERTGVITALILASVGVDENTIMDDYELSNNYFNITESSKYAYKLPIKSQEAITTIYSAKREFINAAKETIESRFGSVNAYLQKELGLKKEQIKQLQNLFLEAEDRKCFLF